MAGGRSGPPAVGGGGAALAGAGPARSRRRLAALAIADAELARDLAAPLELELAVSDLADHPAALVHGQPAAHREIALVDAADLGLLDLAAADEMAGRLDLERAGRVHRDLDVALDHQPLAGRDLALEPDALADDQPLVGLAAVEREAGLGRRPLGRLGAASRGAPVGRGGSLVDDGRSPAWLAG